jgi:hypothetical protein
MSPLPVTMRFNSSRQEIISSLEGWYFDCFGVAEFCPTIICFLLQYAINQGQSASIWVVSASSGFDDFGVEELHEEVWWEYFEIHRGIVVFALGIFSVKDDVMNSLKTRNFFHSANHIMNSWPDVPLNVLTVASTVVDEDELLLDDMMSIVAKCRFGEIF